MKLFIQNMVSLRCKLFVKSELEKLGVSFSKIELGEVNIIGIISAEKVEKLKIALHEAGLELIDQPNSVCIEKLKNIIIEMVHYAEELPRVKNSDYISEKMNMNYCTLSILFSQTKGITIEHYIILHKVEKIKELLLYDNLNINQIAYKMNYSSAAHLSNQFKKITGLSPSFFKTLKQNKRRCLEEI
jgi:AraC-like DNA-binding protein